MGTRESEGCIVAMKVGNGVAPGPSGAKAARVSMSSREATCPALDAGLHVNRMLRGNESRP